MVRCSPSKLRWALLWLLVITLLLLLLLDISFRSNTPSFVKIPYYQHKYKPHFSNDNVVTRDKVLGYLGNDLFPLETVLSYKMFERCLQKRRNVQVFNCLDRRKRSSFDFVGVKLTDFIPEKRLEICVSDEQSIHHKLYHEKKVLDETDEYSYRGRPRKRILFVQNPLIRIFQLWEQTKHSRWGYYNLGERIVFKVRQVERISYVRKLLFIYTARLSLVSQHVQHLVHDYTNNPYVSPFGPTFEEFVSYFLRLDVPRDISWAPGSDMCPTCKVLFQYIIKNKAELDLLQASISLSPASLKVVDNIDMLRSGRVEVLRQYEALPEWQLVRLYQFFENDINFHKC